MKLKELAKLREKGKVELIKLAGEKYGQLVKVQIESSVGREKNLKKAKNAKREIAQIKTLVREAELFDSEK